MEVRESSLARDRRPITTELRRFSISTFPQSDIELEQADLYPGSMVTV